MGMLNPEEPNASKDVGGASGAVEPYEMESVTLMLREFYPVITVNKNSRPARRKTVGNEGQGVRAFKRLLMILIEPTRLLSVEPRPSELTRSMFFSLIGKNF